MPMVLPEGLAPEVYPLAWLVGRWQGQGVIEHPATGTRTFVQDVEFSHDGGPYLAYSSTIRVLSSGAPDDAAPEGAAGAAAEGAAPGGSAASEPAASRAAENGQASPATEATTTIWSTESGYWRVAVGSQDVQVRADQRPVEVLIADPSGYVTVYLGAVGNGRVDLVSDLVARTSTGAEVTAGTRMYGLVRGDLMWAWDLAAFGHPMRSYASAQLSRKETSDG